MTTIEETDVFVACRMSLRKLKREGNMNIAYCVARQLWPSYPPFIHVQLKSGNNDEKTRRLNYYCRQNISLQRHIIVSCLKNRLTVNKSEEMTAQMPFFFMFVSKQVYSLHPFINASN